MYRHDNRQLTFEEFSLPFRGSLNPKNRWVIKANTLPWDFVDKIYIQRLKDSIEGRGAKSSGLH